MGTKRRIVIIAVLLVVGGGLVWLVLRPRGLPEPVFKGKPLSYWVLAYDVFSRAAISNRLGGGFPSTNAAAEALREIGTNAFPKLLEMLQERNPPLQLKLVALAQKQHFIKINFIPASSRNVAASRTLQVLGDLGFDLRVLLPDLIKIYEKNISASSVAWTCGIFIHLGSDAEPAVPALRRGMTNADEYMRFNSLFAFADIRGYDSEIVIGLMTNAMRDPSPMIREQALMRLARFGRNAEPPVLALLLMALKDPNDRVRTATLFAIDRLCRDQPEDVAPALAKLVHDPVPRVRQIACGMLAMMGSASEPVISALLEALKDPEPTVSAAARRAILKLDPQAAAKAGVQ